MTLTPSQTVGPYLGIGLPYAAGPEAAADGVLISGRVFDGAGEVVPDALIETWSPAPAAFARCPTDDEGRWHVRIALPADGQVAVSVFARGMLNRVVTRIYFALEDVPEAVPAARRVTLVAVPAGAGAYTFDVRLQGPGETVFLDL